MDVEARRELVGIDLGRLLLFLDEGRCLLVGAVVEVLESSDLDPLRKFLLRGLGTRGLSALSLQVLVLDFLEDLRFRRRDLLLRLFLIALALLIAIVVILRGCVSEIGVELVSP